MTGSKPDELIRTPMQWTAGPNAGFSAGEPWEPVNQGTDGPRPYQEQNVEAALADGDSLLNHYRKLIAARNEHPALRSLGFLPLESSAAPIYGYLRHSSDEAILVVLNFDDEAMSEYGLSLSGAPLSPGDYAVADLLTGAEAAPLVVEAEGAIHAYRPLPELPPRSALVLRLAGRGR